LPTTLAAWSDTSQLTHPVGAVASEERLLHDEPQIKWVLAQRGLSTPSVATMELQTLTAVTALALYH
jgi:hypothetical protein